ncbi:hypothetical protein [Pseudomonas syringae group genomosp. 3]|uniref:hypothetical protein n=1 Tax=Pseudomonas syringae group genomosp. 3 TaxID=251701 RepID=UPI001C829E64|nr:hypothetical protein [Pseudomonas syringae group genomosp. 3]MBX6414541.1 hypothetical protein [Pseudomonas syringae pv. tomato]MBX6450640.1 hypothetical protein [Pseudomonas syringae pv. tomato]MBX6608612.1 hypothetical protein [Pseudomonas syringae pv. tomato]MBX6935552.1 hypothetical protein [Pseudomonas syringae pv. tomato]
MADKTFKQWLHEDGRHEALQDVYFEDQIEFLDWAESVYKAMQRPASANEPRLRSWPFTK